MVYLTTGYAGSPMWAMTLEGAGDVTESGVVWRYAKNIPRKPSPLLINDLLFLLDDSGVMTCLEAKTGEEIWKERIGGTYSASPLYADGRIYCFSEQGKTYVLKPGRTLEVLSESQLDAGFMSSPAVTGKSLILRTKTHLYRIDP
jgi:outer membrane protein assembly factor BamB